MPKPLTRDALRREVLTAFWKAHVLHHAGERPVHGFWLLAELREHGYRLSPGTLYPLLKRMERGGWLRPVGPDGRASTSRRLYGITARGRRVLRELRGKVSELHDELVMEAERDRRSAPGPRPMRRRPRMRGRAASRTARRA